MDRLTSGQATGGSGGTYSQQTYTYSSSTGNLSNKAGVSYTYGDSNHKHAVTAMGSDTYTYDANGNQITRNVGGSSYTLSYDAENRLISVSGAVTATFVYDGDGNRVKGTVAGVTATYVGNYFEWKTNTTDMKKYYYAGSTRVAMCTGTNPFTPNFLLGDHSLVPRDRLGSTAITVSISGTKTAELRYYPWGTTRYTYGSNPTTFQYTGQRLQSEIGLYFYGARWYDPAAGRFIQADSIIPEAGNSQAWDRYAYVTNNPIKYVDPTGHNYCDERWAVLEDCSDIELTGSGQDLINLAQEQNIDVEEVIRMAVGGEISSWYKDDKLLGMFNEAVINHYAWYVGNSCGGNASQTCRINFWSTWSGTIKILIDTYQDSPPGTLLEDYSSPWVAEDRWDEAGIITQNSYDRRSLNFNQREKADRGLPFDVEIILTTTVNDLLGMATPREGPEFNQFLYFESVIYHENPAYSVIMNYDQWLFWSNK